MSHDDDHKSSNKHLESTYMPGIVLNIIGMFVFHPQNRPVR